jgi:hypothetical protein
VLLELELLQIMTAPTLFGGKDTHALAPFAVSTAVVP